MVTKVTKFPKPEAGSNPWLLCFPHLQYQKYQSLSSLSPTYFKICICSPSQLINACIHHLLLGHLHSCSRVSSLVYCQSILLKEQKESHFPLLEHFIFKNCSPFSKISTPSSLARHFRLFKMTWLLFNQLICPYGPTIPHSFISLCVCIYCFLCLEFLCTPWSSWKKTVLFL